MFAQRALPNLSLTGTYPEGKARGILWHPAETKAAAILFLALFSAHGMAASQGGYENFSLPQSGGNRIANEAGMNFQSGKVNVHGTNARYAERTVDHKEYLFAKQAFVSEKRDEAIKLIRQELDAGFKRNRDNMLLRLGQLYAEKYMELSYHENDFYTRQLLEQEKNKAKDKRVPKLDSSRSQQYLKQALSLFYQLEREYPRHAKMDEVIFFIGFVELESGNNKKGVSYLERVVKKYPKSRKFDEAVIYLGDHYFDNHKFKDAIAKYHILEHRTDSSLKDYARYKLAWCYLNTAQQRKGLNDMKAVVADLAGNDDKAKFNLREQALRDLVIFFAEAEAVEEADHYFMDKLGREKATQNLKLMADILRSKARDAAAVRAYKRVLEENPNSPDAPAIYVGLFESSSRSGQANGAVDSLVIAMEKFGETSGWLKGVPPERLKEAKAGQDELQIQGMKAALFFHQSAQKSSNKGSYQHALKLYGALLDYFPNHPDKKKIAFYRGDILFNQGKWVDSANSYMAAAQVPPKDKVTDESIYNALLALDHLTQKSATIERYSKEDQKKVDMSPMAIPAGELRFIEVANYYLKEYPTGDKVIDVKFRVASIYYRYHHFDEAIVGFKEIALSNPKHRSAPTAAHLVLDIFNIKTDYETLNATALIFANTPGWETLSSKKR